MSHYLGLNKMVCIANANCMHWYRMHFLAWYALEMVWYTLTIVCDGMVCIGNGNDYGMHFLAISLYGMHWHWYGMQWYGMVWYGMVCIGIGNGNARKWYGIVISLGRTQL
jgi:hypothetical protein